jgi:hypothetical protein
LSKGGNPETNTGTTTEKILGYNAYGLSAGTETIIPSAAGALAGTYVHENKQFTPNTSQLESYEDSADGGLPEEIVSTSYDNAGQPCRPAGSSPTSTS